MVPHAQCKAGHELLNVPAWEGVSRRRHKLPWQLSENASSMSSPSIWPWDAPHASRRECTRFGMLQVP